MSRHPHIILVYILVYIRVRLSPILRPLQNTKAWRIDPNFAER
jgi:hypothetical protein